VIALVFKADWCTACRVLEPKLMTVMPQVAAQPIRFVMLDQTDADARRAAATEARALGVAELYAAREGQTGYVLLVDASTKEVLGQIGSTDSVAQIRQKIRRALAAA
jgi:thiol:disulfide interchange protein